MENELTLQEQVSKKLQSREIYPYSIFFTYAVKTGGLLSITFFAKSDLDEVLECLSYKSQCDKTGYVIMEETNTLILSDLALIQFYIKLC